MAGFSFGDRPRRQRTLVSGAFFGGLSLRRNSRFPGNRDGFDGDAVRRGATGRSARCPPGPYERASLIAFYLKARKPRSKLIILDAKMPSPSSDFSSTPGRSFDLLEWVPLSKGGAVTEVDPATKTFITDFDKHQASVGNVIPPQKAGRIGLSTARPARLRLAPVIPMGGTAGFHALRKMLWS